MLISFCALALVANATFAASVESYSPLTPEERWRLYLRNTYWSPNAFFRAAGPALGAQLSDEPPRWGQGTEGYARRFAHRIGMSAIQGSLEAAGAAALGHEVRYIRGGKTGFLPRLQHALLANFVTYDRAGTRVPHYARTGSVFAAHFAASRWMPDGYRDAGTAMRGVGIEFGTTSLMNVAREFAPEIKRTFRASGGGDTAPLQVVPHVDLSRYAGKWYEIARLPNRFQRDCAADTAATYTLKGNGKIEVLNECRTAGGRIKSAKGKAKVADPGGSNTKLKVTFFWPFSGDYWIIGLDPDYRWALVGEPGRKYLWVLSRDPQMAPDVYDRIIQIARQQGYDTARIMSTPQGAPQR